MPLSHGQQHNDGMGNIGSRGLSNQLCHGFRRFTYVCHGRSGAAINAKMASAN